jgi:hypothetical protein
MARGGLRRLSILEATVSDYLACDCCGRLTHIDELDAKPANIDARFPPVSLFDRVMKVASPRNWRLRQLDRALDANAECDRLECSACYGPGYVSLRGNNG